MDVTPCPQCGREAPIVYRGVVPHCTACGGMRAPLSSASVNLTGKPSRLGGTVATVIGWLVLVFGACATLGVSLIVLAFASGTAALAVGLPMALLTLAVGVVLLKSGKVLEAAGVDAERATQTQALLAMATHKGAVTAQDAAVALGVSVARADAMLTDLAKREPERVAVDVDDQGVVWYRVSAAPGEPIPRTRVDVVGFPAGEGAQADQPEESDDEQAERAARAPR